MSRRCQTSRRTISRRAMALLFVLMVMVLTNASVVSLARVSVSSRVFAELHADTRLCDDLQRAAHIAILQWLHRDAARASVPIDAEQPRIQVLDDHWASLDAERTQRVRITAWDQLGMLPLSHLRASSPLSSVLPDDLRRIAQSLAESQAPGLDQLEQGALARFPAYNAQDPAIGALVATHNPHNSRRRARHDAGAINVNTAPLPLIEAAMRLNEHDGIDQVIEARSSGRLASVPGGSRTRDSLAPRLTAQSNAWSFRVDLASGPVHQSWWCVYLNDGSRWHLAQRLLIDDRTPS